MAKILNDFFGLDADCNTFLKAHAWEELVALRQLVGGPQEFRNSYFEEWKRRPFDRLVAKGLATHGLLQKTPHCKEDLHLYQITGKGRDLYERDAALIKDASTLVSDADVKKARRNYLTRLRNRLTPKADFRFPTLRDVAHRVKVDAQAPDGLTFNDDGEFSGKALTEWYVKEFCRLNNRYAGFIS